MPRWEMEDGLSRKKDQTKREVEKLRPPSIQ